MISRWYKKSLPNWKKPILIQWCITHKLNALIIWFSETVKWKKFNRIFTSDLMLNLIRCIVWFIIIYTRYWRGDECCRYWVLPISVYLEWPKHEIRECGVDSIYLSFPQIITMHSYYKQKPKLKVLTPNEMKPIQF